MANPTELFWRTIPALCPILDETPCTRRADTFRRPPCSVELIEPIPVGRFVHIPPSWVLWGRPPRPVLGATPACLRSPWRGSSPCPGWSWRAPNSWASWPGATISRPPEFPDGPSPKVETMNSGIISVALHTLDQHGIRRKEWYITFRFRGWIFIRLNRVEIFWEPDIRFFRSPDGVFRYETDACNCILILCSAHIFEQIIRISKREIEGVSNKQRRNYW